MANTLLQLIENYYYENRADIVRAKPLDIYKQTFLDEVITNYSLDTSIITSSNFTNIVFQTVDFSASNVYKSEFRDCLFYQALFSKADFNQCNFINCKFINSRLSKVEMEHTRFQNCQFDNVDLIAGYYENCTFEQTFFSKVKTISNGRLGIFITDCQFQKNDEFIPVNSEEELLEFFQAVGSLDSSDIEESND